MSKGDLLVERGARRLEQLSHKAAAKGGFAAKISGELADDAVFLRRQLGHWTRAEEVVAWLRSA